MNSNAIFLTDNKNFDDNKILQKIRKSNNVKNDILNFIILIDQNEIKTNSILKNQYEELIFKIFNEFYDSIDLDIVNYYYWHTDFAIGVLSRITDKKYEKSLTKIINHTQNLLCTECGNNYLRHFNSRQKYKEAKSNNRYSICDICDDKLIQEHELLIEEKILEKEEILQMSSHSLIENLKSMPYKEYLQTDHWKETRKKALHRANYKCQLCSNKDALNVHHNTYENRGQEKDEDLIVLCQECHAKHHEKSEDKDMVVKNRNKTKTAFFIYIKGLDNSLDTQINTFLENTYYNEIVDIKMTQGNNDSYEIYSALLIYS